MVTANPSRCRTVEPHALRAVAKSYNGAALVIVLSFVVLLTGLVIAFFSRASSQMKISANSASQIKTDVFARCALDEIVGDLKQEIAAGSNLSSTVVSGTDFKKCYPASPQAAVPMRTGTNAPANLLKWSGYGIKFFDDTLLSGTGKAYPNASGYPPNQRAANLLSTGTSLNGRSLSLARWNNPLLLPKANPASTDVTPATSGAQAFAAPAWILVARDGGNPTASGSNVIGRYAYCIYDEGGVLDMNVAG